MKRSTPQLNTALHFVPIKTVHVIQFQLLKQAMAGYHERFSISMVSGYWSFRSSACSLLPQSILQTETGVRLYVIGCMGGTFAFRLNEMGRVFLETSFYSWLCLWTWVGPMSLSSLIPPDFPLHIDSIRAELFSRHMSSSSPAASYQGNIMMIFILDIFRQKVILAYGGNIKQVPTIFSITRASSKFDHNRTQFKFGVSAPRGRDDQTQSQMAELVRSYRVRQCWGEHKPPRQSEGWKHGQCAENQSFVSVVAQCADLDLKNVIIDTLAMRKSGELVGMCGNCQSYV